MGTEITKPGIVLPIEAADAITLATLQELHQYINRELEDYDENGEWMHPDDVAESKELIPALEKVILYFGG